jgi:hypothetical protein
MTTAPSPVRVILKGVLLFLVLEFVLASVPLRLDGPNAYSVLGLERQRLPVSTLPSLDSALDVGNLDAMLASHMISRPKAPNEFRVLVLGDSAVWGLQLEPRDTLPAQLDRLRLSCKGKDVRFYNLSFPRSSATKDLMILDRALRYQPDMVVWLITWYTLMPKTRLDHWLITQNPEEFTRLADRFNFLPKDYLPTNPWDMVFDRNRSLFRVTRYQFYALTELAMGAEQIAGPPQVPAPELSADSGFEGLKPPTLRAGQVSLDQVEDFYDLAASTPVVLVNEPMLVVKGVPNSDVRYNSYYPRWVYDQYRQYVTAAALKNDWHYLDLWDAIPAAYFDDTPLHLKPEGQQMLAQMLEPAIIQGCR